MDRDLEAEIRKSLKSGIKKDRLSLCLIILGVLVAIACVVAVNFRIHAKSTGQEIGNLFGTAVGNAVGSFQGITTGLSEGYEAGMQEGLSAEDTVAEISAEIQKLNKLEVLVASGTYSDVLSIGSDPIDYAALLSMQYNAVFTVNLGTAEIKLSDSMLHVYLDQPEVEFFPVGETQIINEYLRTRLDDGSVTAGYSAALNSLNKLSETAQAKIQSSESMMDTAREAATVQIRQLVNAISVSGYDVGVEFRGENM